MCTHLAQVETALKEKGIAETYRGQPWTENCHEWVYFDCIFDLQKLRMLFHLPDFVEDHRNDDMRSGLEAGIECTLCHDAIMGLHPEAAAGKKAFP